LKQIAAYLLILSLATSCKNGPQIPLAEEVLIMALADTHIAEAAVQNLSGTYKDSMKQVYFMQTMEIHQIDETKFRQSIDSLAANPEIMEKIIRKVERRLAELEAQSAENQREE